MPRKKITNVVEVANPKICSGCEVLVQSDKTLEQNINFHREEMVDKWRLQEEVNKTVQQGFITLNGLMAGYLERMHKLEKSVIYAAVTIVVSTLVNVGLRFVGK
jgi:hypothetical protein